MIDWISVEERLPEVGCKTSIVKIKTIDGIEHKAMFCEGLVKSHWMIMPSRTALTTDKITHWAEINEPESKR